MDGLVLLERARAAGLTVHVDAGHLVVRGPKSAGELAHQLLANKEALIAQLSAARPPTRDPRPDLTADSRDWTRLLKLTLAEHGDGPDSVLGVLHGIRCSGAVLTKNDTGALAPPWSSPGCGAAYRARCC